MDRLLPHACLAVMGFASGWAFGFRRAARALPVDGKEKIAGGEKREKAHEPTGIAIGQPPGLPRGHRVASARCRDSSPSVSDGDSDVGEARAPVMGSHRLVLVVRMDLGLARGKIGSQLCHAALGQFKKMYRAKNPNLWDWERDGRSTVVLRTPNEAELTALKDAARVAGIPTHTVVDQSSDHRDPVKTVMALGPYGSDAIGQVTGHLSLY